MKILLVNPTVIFDFQFGKLKKFYNPLPSVGLANIGGVLRQHGFEVVGQDSFVTCHSTDQMYDGIIKEAPDVVGISVVSPSSPCVDAILPKIRQALPGTVIVLGHIHASVFHKSYLEKNMADYIVHHEGEATMLELMQAVKENKDVGHIEGISYLDKKTGIVIKTPNRAWIKNFNLDEMPYPAWDLFPVDQFKPDIRMLGQHKVNNAANVEALPIVASRGCPYRCTFCSPMNTLGNAYRMRSPKSVADEMEFFYKKWGTNTFYYVDLIFPINEQKGIIFCDHLIERNLPVKWACETRVSSVTLKLLKKMKEAGCYRVDFGIESGSQKLLDLLQKRFTLDQVKKAVDACREAGIESEGLFIIGLPEETVQETWDTINFALGLDLDHFKLNLFIPYPGSELWDKLSATGEIIHSDFGEYTSFPTYTGARLPFVPKGRTEKELMRLQKIGMRKAFFRKKVIVNELKNFKFNKISEYTTAITQLLFPPKHTRSAAC